MQQPFQFHSFALLLISLFLSTACSTVTTSEGMTPEASNFASVNQNPQSVALLVSGETRGITIENFEQALADGITVSKLFASVQEAGEFLLEVQLQKISQPLFGAGFTITIDSTWKLFRLSDRELLWDEQINASYKGGAFEGGVVGANRARVATERAARENIRMGIEKLGQAQF